MRASLRDVARLAGVSVKTAANVVHGRPNVSPATRENVEAALKQLNYRPNIAARMLRQGRSGVIAVAVPEIQNPYFAELAGLLIQEASQRSLTVLIDSTGGTGEQERYVLNGIRDQHVDGVILIPRSIGSDDLQARQDHTPLVLLGDYVDDATDSVAVDHYAVARSATEHLLELGRLRVAAVGGRGATEHIRRRFDGYRDTLADAGHRVYDDMVATSTQTRAGGKAAAEQLLSLPEPPDALFCFNDLIALGCIRALNERGIPVPDDIAVIGIDDIEDARFSTPALSSVAPDKRAIARNAIEILVKRIDGDTSEDVQQLLVPHTLKARESTLGLAGLAAKKSSL